MSLTYGQVKSQSADIVNFLNNNVHESTGNFISNSLVPSYVQNDLPVIHVSKYGKQWPVQYGARSVPSGMVTIETEIVSLNLIPCHWATGGFCGEACWVIAALNPIN